VRLLLSDIMILSDFDLRNYISSGRLVVKPFTENIIRENGLDLRIGTKFKKLRRTNKVFDTKLINEDDLGNFYEEIEGYSVTIQPYEKVLILTLEYLELPPELMGFVNLRSSFARLGLTIPPTIIDGGFRGNLVVEVTGSSFPVKLYTGQRFIHVVFAKTTTPILKPYQGYYQDQKTIVLPKVSQFR